MLVIYSLCHTQVPPPSVDVPLSPTSKEPHQADDKTVTTNGDPIIDKSSDEPQRRGCEAEDKKSVPPTADADVAKPSEEPQRLARQRGCEAYEALSGVERLEVRTVLPKISVPD
jgi:hypothetical protein